jgi:pimeloyl-ACP methyl ester carboxylesterase
MSPERRQAIWPFAPIGERPEATGSDGPDPYGNPDPAPQWLSVDWREHLRSVEIDGARINYVEVGDPDPSGPELVFVHGLAGCWQNWLEQLPHFGRSYRVVAMDLPGFGQSPMPPWEISIRNYGKLVHAFCEALELDPLAIVGNSMGGFVAAEAVITEPERFRRLVLVSAAGISHAHMRREPAEALARVAAAATPLVLRYQDIALQRPTLRRRAFRHVFHRPLEIRSELLWEQFHGAMDAPGFLNAIGGLVGYDILDRLEEVEIPTLIVWGRDDLIVPPSDALGFARRLRNSRIEVFDRCGHVPQLERPVRFNRLLEGFLGEGEGGATAGKSGAEQETETLP